MSGGCAIIGCTPICFPWGYDEEDENCVALKLLMLHQITALREQGIARFNVSMDCGAGLYAAEMLNGLRETDGDLEWICYIPYEEQAIKWIPELRERYFNALESCSKVITVTQHKTIGCEFAAYLAAIQYADTVFAIFDADNPKCEREANIVSVAKENGKMVIVLDPASIGQIMNR